MAGFGASVTGASASLIAAMATPRRNALMADLFQTAGLNYLRQPIGATDFNRTADFYTYDDGAAFADTLMWHAENLLVQNARNGGESTITWNLALDPSGGPHQGGCSTRCNGVVEINDSGYIRNAVLVALNTASGSGAATTTVSFPTQTKRYLRIVQTGSAGNWWSIQELNLYS
ncbi:hypothetical protein [Nonomuraea sp. NPDC049480]|uniref:hypothetical protein n=1 Tax=Nonomuraea sp. NPDC049480 TaxID=3364353 RepID=UPI00378D80C5